MNEAVKPVRIQLCRSRGFNLQAVSHELNGLSCVKVDRRTKWGNPFSGAALASIAAMHVGKRGDIVHDRNFGLVALYANWISGWPRPIPMLVGFMLPKEMPEPPSVEDIRRTLRGHNLGCWCPIGSPCHADVLLEIANPQPPRAAIPPSNPPS